MAFVAAAVQSSDDLRPRSRLPRGRAVSAAVLRLEQPQVAAAVLSRREAAEVGKGQGSQHALTGFQEGIRSEKQTEMTMEGESLDFPREVQGSPHAPIAFQAGSDDSAMLELHILRKGILSIIDGFVSESNGILRRLAGTQDHLLVMGMRSELSILSWELKRSWLWPWVTESGKHPRTVAAPTP